MTTIAFDSLKYTKKLEAAGFTREQAEAQIYVQQEALVEACEDFVSKSDVVGLKKDSDTYRSDIISVRADIAIIKTDIAVLKWMMGMTMTGIAALMLKAFFM